MIIRLLLLAAAVVILLLYIPPLVSLGVVNAGNLFGFGISGILLAFSIFWKPLTGYITDRWQKGAGKAILSVILIGILAFFTLFFATLGQVVAHSHYTAENQSTVIVLGCQIRGSKPSSTLKARCKVAANYLENHPDAVAIATGGQGSDEDLSEGQCIYQLMTEAGIAPERIWIEDKSTNTDENIANAKIIMEENGLSTDVAVATSEYHQYRASLICKKNGLTAASISSASSKRAKPTFFTREVFGVWVQWLQGIR